MPGHQDGAPSEEKEPATRRRWPGPGPEARSQEPPPAVQASGQPELKRKNWNWSFGLLLRLGREEEVLGSQVLHSLGTQRRGREMMGEIPETGIQIEESVTQKPERGCGLNQAREQTRWKPECRQPQGTGRRGRRTRGNMGRKAQEPDGACVPGSRETSTVSAKPERKGTAELNPPCGCLLPPSQHGLRVSSRELC